MVKQLEPNLIFQRFSKNLVRLLSLYGNVQDNQIQSRDAAPNSICVTISSNIRCDSAV